MENDTFWVSRNPAEPRGTRNTQFSGKLCIFGFRGTPTLSRATFWRGITWRGIRRSGVDPGCLAGDLAIWRGNRGGSRFVSTGHRFCSDDALWHTTSARFGPHGAHLGLGRLQNSILGAICVPNQFHNDLKCASCRKPSIFPKESKSFSGFRRLPKFRPRAQGSSQGRPKSTQWTPWLLQAPPRIPNGFPFWISGLHFGALGLPFGPWKPPPGSPVGPLWLHSAPLIDFLEHFGSHLGQNDGPDRF